MTHPPPDPAALLEFDDVVRVFPLRGAMPWSRRRGDLRAVDGLSFRLQAGRTLSLVGESGSGKTTTARLALGIDLPSTGHVRYKGTDIASLRGDAHRQFRRGVQAVFQDPTSSLNPRHRVGYIVGEPLIASTDLSRAQTDQRVVELLEMVGLSATLRRGFPHELSGGMRQRVAVARALALSPEMVVLDEPVSALDVSIRAQIMNLLKDLQRETGVAYFVIAHDLATVRYLSHEVATMYLGQIVEYGTSSLVFEAPLHPYTIALHSAARPDRPDKGKKSRIVIHGEIPSPADPPPGCRFHPRCWLRRELGNPEACTAITPVLRPIGLHQSVACHFSDDLEDPSTRSALIHEAAKRSVPQRPAG